MKTDKSIDPHRPTNKNDHHEGDEVKIKSSVISPPEPTPHPKDYEAIEY